MKKPHYNIHTPILNPEGEVTVIFHRVEETLTLSFNITIGKPPVQSIDQFLSLFQLVVVPWRRSYCV